MRTNRWRTVCEYGKRGVKLHFHHNRFAVAVYGWIAWAKSAAQHGWFWHGLPQKQADKTSADKNQKRLFKAAHPWRFGKRGSPQFAIFLPSIQGTYGQITDWLPQLLPHWMCGGAVATARFVNNGNCVIIRFQPMRFMEICLWIGRICSLRRKHRFIPAVRILPLRLAQTCLSWHITERMACLWRFLAAAITMARIISLRSWFRWWLLML